MTLYQPFRARFADLCLLTLGFWVRTCGCYQQYQYYNYIFFFFPHIFRLFLPFVPFLSLSYFVFALFPYSFTYFFFGILISHSFFVGFLFFVLLSHFMLWFFHLSSISLLAMLKETSDRRTPFGLCRLVSGDDGDDGNNV